MLTLGQKFKRVEKLCERVLLCDRVGVTSVAETVTGKITHASKMAVVDVLKNMLDVGDLIKSEPVVHAGVGGLIEFLHTYEGVVVVEFNVFANRRIVADLKGMKQRAYVHCVFLVQTALLRDCGIGTNNPCEIVQESQIAHLAWKRVQSLLRLPRDRDIGCAKSSGGSACTVIERIFEHVAQQNVEVTGCRTTGGENTYSSPQSLR